MNLRNENPGNYVVTRKRRTLEAALALFFFINSYLTIVHFFSINQYWPQDYSYRKITASNGVTLYSIRTSPRNVTLKAIDTNVTLTGDYGINGGFFYNGDLLSMAILNDQPIKGKPGDYGSGWYNTNRKKGTLVWDDEAGRFSVQVAGNASELWVTNRFRYWAQGGVSMELRNDFDWYQQAAAEAMPAMEEDRMRSGMLYDLDQNLWLVVTQTRCTVAQFRDAIKETLTDNTYIDGVFLDGDGSSQMKAAEARLKGDNRQVYQMISLIR